MHIIFIESIGNHAINRYGIFWRTIYNLDLPVPMQWLLLQLSMLFSPEWQPVLAVALSELAWCLSLADLELHIMPSTVPGPWTHRTHVYPQQFLSSAV